MNLRDLSEILGLEEADVLDLVDLFVNTCTSDLAKLEEGIQSGHHQTVADAAHSIKGASGNMRFDTIYELSKDIEDSARAQDLSEVSDRLAGIRKELEKIAADIKTYRK